MYSAAVRFILIRPHDAVGRKGRCWKRWGQELVASRQMFPASWNSRGTLNRMPEQPVHFNKWMIDFKLEESREKFTE